MFSGEFNPVQHTIRRGKCIHCKQPFPGEGIVYTKQGMLLTFAVPIDSIKFNQCGGT